MVEVGSSDTWFVDFSKFILVLIAGKNISIAHLFAFSFKKFNRNNCLTIYYYAPISLQKKIKVIINDGFILIFLTKNN